MQKSVEYIANGTFAKHWAAASFGRVRRRSYSGSRPTSGRVAPVALPDPSKPPGCVPTHEALGYQLKWGPVQLNVAGNPLGQAGLREVSGCSGLYLAHALLHRLLKSVRLCVRVCV